jgi:hypothetical protein
MSDKWNSVIRVGGGRGFIANLAGQDVIVTAAHCVPWLAEFFAGGDSVANNVVGPLGAEPTISTGCLFVDPVADLAALGEPDPQDWPKDCVAYREFVENRAMTVADASPASTRSMRALLLNLDRRPFSCGALLTSRWIWLEDLAEPIERGMSGSPIMLPDGTVIGVVGWSNGPDPFLAQQLPRWLLDKELVRCYV